VAIAAHEGVRRSARSYAGIRAGTFLALLLGVGVTLGTTTRFVLHVDPWWEPRYLIPLVGMILGNALTGISLSLDRCLAELDEGRALVEAHLAMGASRWEAARPVARDALRTGLIPLLNSMNVVGLVTVPGMMTGQLLGGTPPALAARYQILIMFLVAAATALGAGLAVLLSLHRLFDAEHRLRADRLLHRKLGP
jgi:putative ABC transport system permease protein